MRTDTEILDYLSNSWARVKAHDSVVGRVYWSTNSQPGTLREVINMAINRDEAITVNQVLHKIQESYADEVPAKR